MSCKKQRYSKMIASLSGNGSALLAQHHLK